jgi:hypothetical protein
VNRLADLALVAVGRRGVDVLVLAQMPRINGQPGAQAT